ncbi:putative radial spoke head 1 [Monocercomonoides exilis]|uniref:putative radial spoke head 1 n=1 Tax=Monocercomonoides exilis TaxID=2049356 RepID=UPI00355A0FEE|nr:putative radial spoke head 1 [Monocercomonoides exilis]|eukprot:MONOS_7623.1-p1 / transcript=MONOS_7623.1 / gene=MONOS_7623 / organism=Monocercomonoides_exilis_PA203 / gene_product=meichroacidin / transcript_product=meichroacidin / location=Mono_scaffold00265:57029-58269(+) / protein_length=286 / sequence_SO=supercontig / SO=protein_coding / is_pseudo=false
MAEEEEQEEIDPQKKLGVYEGGRDEGTGERQGYGINRFPNGDIFKGEYVKGKREGPGKYFWKDPIAKYTGTYSAHKKEGYGVMKYPDGSIYDGYFHEGKRHGQGKYTYPNGDTYEGDWENGKKHGKGVFTIKSENSKYIGIWKVGQIIRGVWEIKDGTYYAGKFEKQRPNIEGKYVMVSGNVVSGSFKEETKTIEVPVEEEKKLTAEEGGEEEEEERREPTMKKVEKITLRQFIPSGFSMATQESIAADHDIEVVEGELYVPPEETKPKREGEEGEEEEEGAEEES